MAVEREHLHNRLIRELIAQIASGEHGKRLPSERALCARFGVARGTLRKALTGLEELGVIRIKPNSGAYVQPLSQVKLPSQFLPPDFDSVNLADVIEARKAIETAAVAAAATRMTPAQLHELEGLVARMHDALDDISAFVELDMTFHRALVRASGNAVLTTAFEAIYEYHRFSTVFTSQQEGEEAEALEYHRRLLTALKAEDGPASCRILNEHLDTMSKYSRKAARQQRA